MARGVAEALMGEIAILRPHRGHLAGIAAGGPKPAPKGGAVARRARLWRAGQGGHAAVLKKIHRGGTHSPKQLGAQLDYLFSKAEWCTGNIVDFDPRRQTLSPEERAEIVTTWSDGWTRSPKNGHTTHLLMSLPLHVRPRTARAIGEDWATEMFESGTHGDTWSYVAVLVALEGDRSAVPRKIEFQRIEIGECPFGGHEAQLHQAACRIVDEDEKRAGRGTVLDPAMILTVDLISSPWHSLRRRD